ncbi:MAG: hypothetical protein HOV86_06275 [Thermoactinospora sp.]|nr:hypothetical protein [Thermoactinospora sp.]
MSGATAATYEWLRQGFTDGVGDTWLCLAFVRDVTPEGALRRIGVTPGTSGDSGFGIAAHRARGGTVLAEHGWGEIAYDSSHVLSEGTSAAAVSATIKGSDFTHAVNGRLITTFSLYSYRYREGDDPDRLLSHVRDLGLHAEVDDPGFAEDPVSSALALAERATGVHLSRAHYARPALFGSVDHLHPYR